MNAIANLNTLNLGSADRKYGTWLALAHLFFFYVRPQEYIPGLSAVPLSGILSLALSIWGAVHLRGFLVKTPLFIIVLLGVAYWLSAIDAVNVTAHRVAFKTIVEVLPQCIAIYILFDNKERLATFLKFWCVVYFAMGLITIVNGGRGPGDFTGDENDAALALSIGFPICFYALWYPGFDQKFRIFAGLSALVVAGAITITASRGGFLGLVAVILTTWWLSSKRFKIAAYVALVSIVLSGALLSVLPEGYLDEVRSINDAEDSTRIERFRLWETAWEMYKDNPFVGVGVSNQRYHMSEYARKTSWYSGDGTNYQGKVAHSIYFQVISETGTFGGLIYLYILFLLPLGLYRLRNSIAVDDEDNRLQRLLCQTLMVSMGAYIVSGAFISVAYYPHIPLWITMYAIVRRLALNKSNVEENSSLKEEEADLGKPNKQGFKWDNE